MQGRLSGCISEGLPFCFVKEHMENNQELKITIAHVEKLISIHSTSTVGEIMKRFESIED